MKRSFIRAAAAVLMATGGAYAQSPLPDVSAPERPEARVSAPARSGIPAVGNGHGTLVSSSPASTHSHSTSTWVAPTATPACPDKSLLPHGSFDPDGPTFTFWGSAEYVLWNIRDGSIPDLTARPPIGVITVTTNDREQTRRADGSVVPPGFVSLPISAQVTGFFPVQIQVIPTIPDGPVDLGNHSGARLAVGAWLTPDHLLGVETSFYFLGTRTARFNNTATNGNGQFIFQTPFSDRDFETVQQTPPDPAIRSVVATRPIFFVRQASSELAGAYYTTSWGGELNARSTFVTVGSVAVGGLAGFRYIDFHESFDLSGRFSLFRPANIPPVSGDDPTRGGSILPGRLEFVTRDTILTRNHFYGGQVGLDIEGSCNGFFMSLRPRIAIGGVHQVVKISGSTTTTADGIVTNAQAGGLLFSPLDVGRFKRDRITVIPELNAKAGYQFTPWLRGYVGYDIMGFVNMARPGDVSVASSTSTQITTAAPAGTTGAASTTVVNVTQPTFRFRESDVLIQGLNFGIELRY